MASVTYYVVVPFARDQDGNLAAGEAKEAPNGESAKRRAQAAAAAEGNIGAVAFSRTGDPDSGDFADAVILTRIGDVDLGALAG